MDGTDQQVLDQSDSSGPELQALDRSVSRRIWTARSGSERSLPDLHRKR